MNVAELLGLPDLESDLDRVDVALRAAVATEDVFLAEVGGHLVRAGRRGRVRLWGHRRRGARRRGL